LTLALSIEIAQGLGVENRSKSLSNRPPLKPAKNTQGQGAARPVHLTKISKKRQVSKTKESAEMVKKKRRLVFVGVCSNTPTFDRTRSAPIISDHAIAAKSPILTG
jgi:hypothetical protein